MKRTKILAKMSPFFADSMLFLAVLCWGISFPIAKLAMNDWGKYEFFFLAGRFWLAFAIFAVLAARSCSWQKLIAHTKPGFWTGITLVAAFGLQYKALSLGSSGEVAFITALSSVLVPLGVSLKKRVKAGIWFGLAIATIGAILVKYKGSFSIDSSGWLAFLSAIGIATYIILIGYFMSQKNNKINKYEKVPFLTMQLLVLAIATTLLSVLIEIPANGIPPWSNNAVFGMLFMSIVATAGAFFIQTKYQPLTSPERTALVFTLEAPFAALFAYLLLGETFTLTMLIGAAMIVAGVAIAEFLEAQKPQAPPGGAAEVLEELHAPA